MRFAHEMHKKGSASIEVVPNMNGYRPPVVVSQPLDKKKFMVFPSPITSGKRSCAAT